MMSQHEPTSDRMQKIKATRRKLRSVSVMGYRAAGAARSHGLGVHLLAGRLRLLVGAW